MKSEDDEAKNYDRQHATTTEHRKHYEEAKQCTTTTLEMTTLRTKCCGCHFNSDMQLCTADAVMTTTTEETTTAVATTTVETTTLPTTTIDATTTVQPTTTVEATTTLATTTPCKKVYFYPRVNA